MSTTTTHFVGLDVHKDTIAIAYARTNTRNDPVFIGAMNHPGFTGDSIS